MPRSDGATTASTLPHGFGGSPAGVWAAFVSDGGVRAEPDSWGSGTISVQLLPPSFERNSPLPLGASGPSPPERKVHPLRRKSHIPAKRTSGSTGSMDRLEQPVERF